MICRFWRKAAYQEINTYISERTNTHTHTHTHIYIYIYNASNKTIAVHAKKPSSDNDSDLVSVLNILTTYVGKYAKGKGFRGWLRMRVDYVRLAPSASSFSSNQVKRAGVSYDSFRTWLRQVVEVYTHFWTLWFSFEKLNSLIRPNPSICNICLEEIMC